MRTPRDELAEATPHGALYLRRLRRSQLALALLCVVAFGGLVAALPLALYLLPGLIRYDVLGVPLPLWLVAVPLFPLFIAFGWIYERRAEGLEDAFRELVDDER
jgi:O-antigen/teichoic acid export membrane protein